MTVTLKEYLPSAPLAGAVDHLAKKEGMKVVCARAGVAVRMITAWRAGERDRIAPDMADQVLTGLDLFWWEVWTTETVREPLFVVTTYNHAVKKDKRGRPCRRRVKVRTIPYGDLGTDFYRLREIELLMTAVDDEFADEDLEMAA